MMKFMGVHQKKLSSVELFYKCDTNVTIRIPKGNSQDTGAGFSYGPNFGASTEISLLWRR